MREEGGGGHQHVKFRRPKRRPIALAGTHGGMDGGDPPTPTPPPGQGLGSFPSAVAPFPAGPPASTAAPAEGVPSAVISLPRVMNFSWGREAIAASATDYAGVAWDGRLRPDHTGTFRFEVGTAEGGDAARLWVDGSVVLDGFERGGAGADGNENTGGLGGGGRGSAELSAGALHDVRLEYRRVEPAPASSDRS